MERALEGRVAIVTGAAGGIGAVYPRALAEAGAAVVVADLDGERAAATAAELEADGHVALGAGVDVTDPAAVGAMVERTVGELGGVDVLVNNAALMSEIPYSPLSEFPLDWWDRVLRVNLTGALICAQAVIPAMKARGGGKIVNQSSAGAFEGGGAYGVSKLGLIALTVSLARELGSSRINVNAIAPGMVSTEAGFRSAPEDSPWRQFMRTQIPFPESGPDGLVGALMLLTTPAGDWITGQTLHVDGGWIMRP